MAPDPLLVGVSASVADRRRELIEVRRDLHANPELSRQERRTTAVVAGRFERVGLVPRLLPDTGLVVDLGPADADHRVALRADLDALPVAERTGLPFSSLVPGICHACGHDLHTTALLGAGLALNDHAEELAERGLAVRLLFQPAEEVIPGGAHTLVEHGALDGVDRIFALHVDPSIDVGMAGLREGPITSAADAVQVTLSGRGGHTSRPHLTDDLTFALAKVITDVPAALSRRLDPRAGAALVWGMVHAGNAPNVIPSEGVASGTLRMLDVEEWSRVGDIVDDIVQTVVAPYGVHAKVEHTRGVPPVVNELTCVSILREAATAVLGPDTDAGTTQSLGGEDYAWYLREVPGALARLGTRTPGGPTYDLHQGDLVVDERAVVLGAQLLAAAATLSPSW